MASTAGLTAALASSMWGAPHHDRGELDGGLDGWLDDSLSFLDERLGIDDGLYDNILRILNYWLLNSGSSFFVSSSSTHFDQLLLYPVLLLGLGLNMIFPTSSSRSSYPAP